MDKELQKLIQKNNHLLDLIIEDLKKSVENLKKANKIMEELADDEVIWEK